jgi:N-acetylglucosaminyldiphosphoundecaprenol N-acetyl-beta-D-mannosaminyltransferase
MAAAAKALTVNILGCAVSRVDMAAALELLERLLESGGKHQVACLTVNSIMSARRDRRFRSVLNGAALALPDGMPVLWASRLLGQRIPGRVAGPDLLLALTTVAARRNHTVYLMGGAKGTAERLAEALTRGNPGLRILGTDSPPVHETFPPEVNTGIIERINAAKPDILWVGLGTPKQDRWIHDNLDVMAVRMAIGVGAAFDLCSGRRRRAPRWVQKAGLEWVYRFSQEPVRLFRRYLVEGPLFVPLVLLQMARQGFRRVTQGARS